MADLPETQQALQLVGPDKLLFNDSKEVHRPGEHQILCRVEAVGLCFSDLKLLKQFSLHIRKSEIVSGIDLEILKEIPSYVPGEKPAVPGHEAVVRIAAVGPGVKDFKVGERYLVQTDYRWVRTASKSNAAFGYNIEGALQEYVLIDKRIATSPEGESMMIPVSEEMSCSAVALVEPWACVEDSYASQERTILQAGGQMLLVADREIESGTFCSFLERYGRPAQITCISKTTKLSGLNVKVISTKNISELRDANYDDVIYFGSDADTAEALFAKVGVDGLLNIVLCGGRFGRDILTTVGRVHYGGIRIIGTMGSDPSESMRYIPRTGEIRDGDKINVVGAAGPMGAMHVVRNVCQGVENVSVYAGDMDDKRLEALTKTAAGLAKKNGVDYRAYNPVRDKTEEPFDYIAIMVPSPELVAEAVRQAGKGAIVNIFAGIPATVSGKIDVDSYIEKQLYFIGTSGSVLGDMKAVLSKMEAGRLDTNVSVAAVCGLEGATEGIRAVEKRLIPGKIIVYPACKGLGLVELNKLDEKMPEVAAQMDNGLWTKQAEQKLLQKYQNLQIKKG